MRNRLTKLALPTILLGLVSASSAPAETVAQGESWVLDSNNWQQAENLLPEVVLERVKKGDYWYTVQPIDPEKFKSNYSKAFWAATEANIGKYDVQDDICGLTDKSTGEMPEFYFGLPFPNIDPKDPKAGCKVAWNFGAAGGQGGGGGATFTLNGIDTNGEYKRIKLWTHLKSFVGIHGGPIDNPEGLRNAGLTSVIEPTDIDGVGGLSKRVNDWESQDKTWFYVPATRRVRRTSASSRSDPVAGMDIFADDLNCYGGKIEYYKWKLAGEGQILAPLLSPDPLVMKKIDDTRWSVPIPYFTGGYETPGAKGVPWLIVENLKMVPRPVWILEGKSEDPYYNFGKVIMYMDRDLYRIYWKLVHNRAGEYFYNAMCAYHFLRDKDAQWSSVSPNLVVGVNDKLNRAALGGRYSEQFVEQNFPEDYFTLQTLTHMSD